MKKCIMLFSLLFLFGMNSILAQIILKNSFVSQNLDNNGNPFQKITIQNRAPGHQSNILTSYNYDSIRALTEINNPNNADAYPWISSDGLRLYYTSGINSNKLVFTQRVNTSSNFVSPVIVPISVVSPSSNWLSANELDIYICTTNFLYFAHRNTVSTLFETPVLISLTGGPSHSSIKGASLNNSQSVLYVCLNSTPAVIAEFSRTSSTSFTYVRTLPIPSGYEAKPGQLSKDGLTFFLSASYNGLGALMYQLTRLNPADTFCINTFQQIQGINDINFRNNQPSMSDNLDWVVFVRNPVNTWDGNDLFIAHKEIGSSVYYSINGVFKYNNTTNSLLSSIEINLMNGTTQIATTTTSASGNYLFTNVPNGSYTIEPITTKIWGGVTSTDVLKLRRHIAGLELLTEPIRQNAADVNMSDTWTSTDVLKMQRRIAGLDNSFIQGDWVFGKPVTGGKIIMVNGANVTQDFYGLCVGDVNGSNIPTQ